LSAVSVRIRNLDDALERFDPEGFGERPRVDLNRARTRPEEHAGRGALCRPVP
jgi:hypothetical protein